MCLINVAHEHLITQTGKKSKPALINFIGPGAEGREKQIPPANICLVKVNIKTLEKGVEYVQSKDTRKASVTSFRCIHC